MYIVKCDRCGKENEVKSLFPIFGENRPEFVPRYSIMETGNDGVRTITLCQDCEKDFDIWIKNYYIN